MRYEGEVKGKVKQARGVAKEKLGKLVGNRQMESKGKREKYEGRLKERMSQARRALGETVEDLGERIASE
jgi:uncharacterized protein YjbJ (UPF0337 family)